MPKTGEGSKLKRFLFHNQTTAQTIAKNTFWLSFGEIFGRLLRVVLIFYAARILGAAGYGTFSYMTSLAAIFTVFSDIGLSGVLVREAAKDKGMRSAYFSTSFFLKIILLVGSLLIILFGADFISGIPLSKTLIYAVAALFVFDSLRRFGSSLFRAEEKMELEALTNIVTQIIILFFGFAILLITPSAESLALAYAIGAGLGLVLTAYFLKDYVRKIFSGFDITLIKPIIRAAWPLTIASVFAIFLVNADTVMIGWFLDAEQVGFYSAAQKPIAFFYLLPAFVVGGLFPMLSRLAAQKNTEKFATALEGGISMVMLIAYPMVAGILFKAQDIIELFYGSGFIEAVSSLQILAATLLVTFPVTIMLQALFAYDRQSEMVSIWTISATLDIGLNYYFIPLLGITGAAWTSLFNQIWTGGFLWRKMRKVNAFKLFKNHGIAIISTVIMIVSILVMDLLRAPFAITLPLSMVVYFASLILLKDPTIARLGFIFKNHDSQLD